jgi:hypothetical protein
MFTDRTVSVHAWSLMNPSDVMCGEKSCGNEGVIGNAELSRMLD